MYDRVGGGTAKRLATIVRSVLTDPGQMLSTDTMGHCPVCGGRRRFFTAGDPPRRRVRCGACLSLERHRLLWLTVDQVLEERGTEISVLHFAPEKFLAEKLGGVKQYVGIDIEPGVDGVVADAQDLPLASASFDVVISSHVLEHVPNDLRAMAEIFRVLRAGGEAVLAVPIAWGYPTTFESGSITDPSLRRVHFGQADHVRFYGADFQDRVERVGFQVDRVRLDPEREIEMGLARGESVFRARKPVSADR